jgi:hypothetical protein
MQKRFGYDGWRFKINNPIVQNLKVLEKIIILQTVFEFILKTADMKCVMKIGLNVIRKYEKDKLPGGGWMIVVKFFESKLSMIIEGRTTIETVIQRIARWLAVGPEFIELIGRLFPGDVKRILTPDTIMFDERNKIKCVNVKVRDKPVSNIVWKEYNEDDAYMMSIQIGGTIYRVNKYLVVMSFKRLLVDKFNNHWPEFYGSDDGICYDNWMLMKDID